jgi:hypothetical protein
MSSEKEAAPAQDISLDESTREDIQALEAVDLYSEDATFAKISEKLGVSKSHAQTLVRRGIDLLQSVNEASTEEIEELEELETPGVTHQNEVAGPPNPLLIQPIQDPRIGSYILETTGIGRRVMLTPKCLMIFDLWRGSGFEGDLSDFLEDAVNFMYEVRPPAERTFNR